MESEKTFLESEPDLLFVENISFILNDAPLTEYQGARIAHTSRTVFFNSFVRIGQALSQEITMDRMAEALQMEGLTLETSRWDSGVGRHTSPTFFWGPKGPSEVPLKGK